MLAPGSIKQVLGLVWKKFTGVQPSLQAFLQLLLTLQQDTLSTQLNELCYNKQVGSQPEELSQCL